MNLFRTIGLLSAVALAATLAKPVAAQTVLKLAHSDQQTSSRHAGSVEFAKRIEERSKGKIKVRVYCCSQLGADPKLVEQLTLGGVDLVVTSTGSFAPRMPSLNLTMLPFVLDSFEQGWKFYDSSAWLKGEKAKMPELGFRFLAPWEAGFRQMTTKEPLTSLADAKGRKMRGWAQEMVLWTLESMGFGVQIIPISEVYIALQQGAVVGQENPIDVINGQKFYEVAPHITLTNHMYSPTPLFASEITWKRLTAEERAILQEVADEITPFMRKLIREQDEKLLAAMTEKGAKVNRSPDIAAFRKAVEPVYAKAREKYGAAADAVLREAEAIRASSK